MCPEALTGRFGCLATVRLEAIYLMEYDNYVFIPMLTNHRFDNEGNNHHIDISSILMIYQHLPNNKDIHKSSVDKKMIQLASNS